MDILNTITAFRAESREKIDKLEFSAFEPREQKIWIEKLGILSRVEHSMGILQEAESRNTVDEELRTIDL
jgi:hypothetical protein